MNVPQEAIDWVDANVAGDALHWREMATQAYSAGMAAERDRIATHVQELSAAAARLSGLVGDGALALGYSAQQEVLASLLHLIGEPL